MKLFKLNLNYKKKNLNNFSLIKKMFSDNNQEKLNFSFNKDTKFSEYNEIMKKNINILKEEQIDKAASSKLSDLLSKEDYKKTIDEIIDTEKKTKKLEKETVKNKHK